MIVTDAAFGDGTDFRDGLRALELPYCVGVREGTRVWPEGQGPLPPAARSRRGRNRSRVRRDEHHQPLSVEALARSLPAQAFRTSRKPGTGWRAGGGRHRAGAH